MSTIGSKKLAESLRSSHHTFSPSSSSDHTVVLKRVQFRRIPVLFSQGSNFRVGVNLSVAVHAFLIGILTSTLIEEILQLRYMFLTGHWPSS